jgi:hypothetical protein
LADILKRFNTTNFDPNTPQKIFMHTGSGLQNKEGYYTNTEKPTIAYIGKVTGNQYLDMGRGTSFYKPKVTKIGVVESQRTLAHTHACVFFKFNSGMIGVITVDNEPRKVFLKTDESGKEVWVTETSKLREAYLILPSCAVLQYTYKLPLQATQNDSKSEAVRESRMYQFNRMVKHNYRW